MDAVERGEAFVLTRGGTPIGELIPLTRRTVTREHFAAMSAKAPPIDPDRFRADLDSIGAGDPRDPYDP